MNIITHEPDLESRINARCLELAQKLDELEADTRVEVAKACDKLRAKLSELRHIIKEGLVDGSASLTEQAGIKLDHWLAESASQLKGSTKDRQS